MKKLLTAFVLLCALSSCNNYYKAITTSQPAASGMAQTLKMNTKYFILREDLNAFAMKNVSVSADEKTMQCSLELLPAIHKLHLTNGREGDRKYKTSKLSDDDESVILNEVHVYVAQGIRADTGQYTMAINNIQKIEALEKDKQKTNKSHAVGTSVAVGLSVLAVAGIAAAALSGPFITF